VIKVKRLVVPSFRREGRLVSPTAVVRHAYLAIFLDGSEKFSPLFFHQVIYISTFNPKKAVGRQ